MSRAVTCVVPANWIKRSISVARLPASRAALEARLGYAEAAALLGLKVATLRTLVHRGQIPRPMTFTIETVKRPKPRPMTFTIETAKRPNHAR
jgi:hypothetical protein